MGSVPNLCPVCMGELEIKVLKCANCDTEIQGNFAQGRFAQLSGEHLQFLETFVKLRGSLKDLCSELGISYPTARNRLDSLIEALGFEEAKTKEKEQMKVLERLKNGEITAEEALSMLKKEV